MNPNILRYFLQIAYRGTHFHGWQVQQNAATVQGTIQKCLRQILGADVPIVGSSRTDRGVHAHQQFAHLDLAPDANIDRLHYQLNATLPPDIAIQAIRPVSAHAHARFDAVHRMYFYTIARTKSPFQRETSYGLSIPLDICKMNEAAAILCHKQDFKSLCKARPVDQHFLCTVSEAYWRAAEDQLVFQIKANRFLRGMVRITVSLLLQVGQGKLTLSDFERIIDQKERNMAISLVPPQGLSLTEVAYPEQIFVT